MSQAFSSSTKFLLSLPESRQVLQLTLGDILLISTCLENASVFLLIWAYGMMLMTVLNNDELLYKRMNATQSVLTHQQQEVPTSYNIWHENAISTAL